MRLWQAYLSQLAKRPQKTKACTSAVTFSLTDCIAQWRERKRDPAAAHDFARTARHGAFGLLWLGPLNHLFWGKTIVGLDYWFPGSSWRAVMTRVFVDQVTLMPINMVMFQAWPHLWRADLEMAKRSVRENFYSSFTFALSIWPLVHPFNFKYVPLEHRLLVLNICSLGVFSYATYVRECSGTSEVASPGGSSPATGQRTSHSPTRSELAWRGPPPLPPPSR